MSEAAKPEGENPREKHPGRKFRAIKGTRDILPPDSALWNWFEATAREVMESYNFGEIRLPIFEETELFARSIGADTDVVNKEMYSFEDRASVELYRVRDAIIGQLERAEEAGEPVQADFFLRPLFVFLGLCEERITEGVISATPETLEGLATLRRNANRLNSSVPVGLGDVIGARANLRRIVFGGALTLRPEATASVVRAYIEHRLDTRPGDQKLYYIGPMFRRERPQKGRYRQFYQIGAEVLGTSDAPAIDAELIEMLTVLLERCQIEKYTLLINSIGCANCRPAYVEVLRAELRKPEIYERLGADSKRRVETNPLRVMDSKLAEEQEIIEKLPKISEHLCEECRAHYEKLKRELALRKVPFTESPRLVRGLDYYMRTTFEITSPILGAQNALCGGGRYDGLVELLGGPKGIKGIGFALGEDRFIDAIQEAKKIHATRPVDVFIAWMGENAYPAAVRLARVLRNEKHIIELPPVEMKFRKALERADKAGARYVLIIGENEIASKQLTVKRLADGVQEKISEDDLVNYFGSKRS